MLPFAPREALGGGCCDTVRDELAAVRWPPEAVRAYCDHLEAAGRAPATIALHLAALRRVAVELGAEARIADLKPSASRAPTLEQLERLPATPDLRTHGRGRVGARGRLSGSRAA
jgi:hypothetical protein